MKQMKTKRYRYQVIGTALKEVARRCFSS